MLFEQQQKEAIIAHLMAVHSEDKIVQQVREQKQAKLKSILHGEPQMRNITEKLNRLEKSLLKQNKYNDTSHVLNSGKDKYEDLNHINERLRKVIATIGSHSSSSLTQIQKRVSQLYNSSVATLTKQGRLSQKLLTLKEQKQKISNEMGSTKADIQRTSLELSNAKALRQVSLKRQQKLQASLHLFD